MPTPPRPLRAVALLLAAGALGGWGRCATAAAPAPRCTGTFQLAWEDQFEGAAGTSPSSANWVFDVGTGTDGWGNNQLEYDTDLPANASLDGAGHLAITARREAMGGQAYTSARMTSRGRHEPLYGRIEARIKLPRGGGLWPAFWLLGANIGTTSYWPACGEIDVMEYLGQTPTRAFSTVHGPGYSGAYGISQAYYAPGGAGFDEDFHTFGVEWVPGGLTFLLDGAQVGATVTPDLLPHNTTWVFDHPFFLILNLAVGGNLGGPVAADTVFPATMLVDWVRVSECVP